MKKLFCALYLLTLAFCGFAQNGNELIAITGNVFFKTKYTLVNNIITIMGTNEAAMISDMTNKTGGRTYRLAIPKDIDVYLLVNKKYVAKINSKNKNYDIYLFDGVKDQTKKHLAEWNKNEAANKLLFEKIYKGRFNSKAMYDENSVITISEPIGEPAPKNTKVDIENGVFDYLDPKIEHVPEFPGGMITFYKYLNTDMQYPSLAKENNVQGKVFLSFIVEKDGILTNITVTRGLGTGCDEEAIRLIKNSAKWKPATISGKKVRCKYNILVNFRLEQ